MTGALGFNPRAALARQDAPRPEGGEVSKLAGLATPTPSNTHSAPGPVGAEVSKLAGLATAPPPNTHSVGSPDEGPEPPGEHDAAEAEAMAAYYGGELSAPSYRPSDRDRLRDGLRVAALQRPPSWSGSTPPPLKGAWCSCCGRSHRSGGRWWRPRNPRNDGLGLGPGWRCWTCHPPPAPSEAEVVET
jgi:hypothetical protein